MSSPTTRRSFLSGIAALLGAPVISALPLRYIVDPSVLKQPRRRWLWVHGSGWMLEHNAGIRCMYLTACRSDGQYFYVVVRQNLEDLIGDPDLVRQLEENDIANAHLTLNDFLNCDCVAGKPCARHYVEPVPVPDELYIESIL